MDGLTELERALLEKLLHGDHPVLAALREQAAQVKLARREQTEAGFFCDLEAPAPPSELEPDTFTLDDVVAELDGVQTPASVVLIVKKGRMTLLEGFTRNEPWPASVGSFRLRYTAEPRDLSVLE
jgi:hypothetical protein